MYIQPITSNENSFKSSLVVKDLKINKLSRFDMTKEAAEKLYDTFSSPNMLNDRKFNLGKGITDDCLARLKAFVAFFAKSVDGTFNKELTYPTAENFSAQYNVTDKAAEINVPEHFSLRLEV